MDKEAKAFKARAVAGARGPSRVGLKEIDGGSSIAQRATRAAGAA